MEFTGSALLYSKNPKFDPLETTYKTIITEDDDIATSWPPYRTDYILIYGTYLKLVSQNHRNYLSQGYCNYISYLNISYLNDKYYIEIDDKSIKTIENVREAAGLNQI